jgi:hypothetical protein
MLRSLATSSMNTTRCMKLSGTVLMKEVGYLELTEDQFVPVFQVYRKLQNFPYRDPIGRRSI